MKIEIFKSKTTIKVLIDSEAVDYFESDKVSDEQKEIISKEIYKMRTRNVGKTIFTLKNKNNEKD